MQTCQWDPRDRYRAGWHAGKLIGQRLIALAAEQISPKMAQASFFFSQDSKEKCSLIFASVIKNIRENDSYVSFH